MREISANPANRQAKPLSFRDPYGFVFRLRKRVFRCVFSHAIEEFREFLDAPFARDWMAAGRIPRTTFLDAAATAELAEECRRPFPGGSIVVEHEALPFANFPYEWTPGMLRAAGALTLDVARKAVSVGFVLKDASPYNIMFDGARPVFLDLLSFRRRDPLASLWRPYAQFVRTFAYPLMACGLGLRLDEILMANREGLDPGRMLSLCPPHSRLLPPAFGAVTIPAILERWSRDPDPDAYHVRHAKDAGEAAYLVEKQIDRAAHMLAHIPAPPVHGDAAAYMEGGHNYTGGEFARKEDVLKRALGELRPQAVLDIGCNTGHFSRLAAQGGARVVAVDRDSASVEKVWQEATGSGLPILPLAVDISRPPGGCGWANRECAPFLERARGQFDCVMLLAVMHHLAVGERVPFEAILELAAGLTTKTVIAEYVDPADAQFKKIARGREALYGDLTRESFEAAASPWFEIAGMCDITPTRRIYILRKSEC